MFNPFFALSMVYRLLLYSKVGFKLRSRDSNHELGAASLGISQCLIFEFLVPYFHIRLIMHPFSS